MSNKATPTKEREMERERFAMINPLFVFLYMSKSQLEEINLAKNPFVFHSQPSVLQRL